MSEKVRTFQPCIDPGWDDNPSPDMKEDRHGEYVLLSDYLRDTEELARLAARVAELEGEKEKLRALTIAVDAILQYEEDGAPDFPDWDRYYDDMKTARKALVEP